MNFNFPCLKGCDEYSTRIHNLPLSSKLFSRTVFISGDFSDAYTASQLDRLKDSVYILGQILGYTPQK